MVCNGILLSHKKSETMPFAATWMDLEMIIPYEVREDKYHTISLMWTLKYDTNELIYKTETDSQT